MDATDLQNGFMLGEWFVEPRGARISGPLGSRVLEPAELALLLCLVARHGESVDRRTLRECAWPGNPGNDQQLREGIRSLREALGGSTGNQDYIVTVANSGYALIAHFEQRPGPAAPSAGGVSPRRSVAGRLQALVIELRRRSVFKVAGAYLVVMWVVLQVAETTFEPLHFPDWWMTALTILAVLGLPIVVVLAWSYEITPGGIVLDEGVVEGVALPKARRAVAPVAVAGVALMAGVTGIAWWRSIDVEMTPALPRVPGHPSVAVLPLVDMSPAGGNAYLGDGLSEELSMRLAQIPGLRVAARTSAFEFKDRNLDVRRIGESLGVRHVLEGSVRRDGDNLRVTMQLIDSTDGYHVWAGSYDRTWSDVIAIQDDIARSVTEALRVVLASDASPVQAATADALDVRAFDPYLAGLALLRQSGDMSRLQEAAGRFREAILVEPAFARAHAGLCQVGVRIFERTRDPSDLARAEESCRQALELDASLMETEKALGGLYLTGRRIAEAEAIYRGLVARNPHDADGHIGLGRALALAGRDDDAQASFRAAIEAEPAYWGAYNALGGFLFSRGQASEAVGMFREVTTLTPSSATAYSNLGAALQMAGDFPAAAEALRHSLGIEASRGAYSNLGTVYFYLGRFEEAATSYERATALARQDQALWGNLADAVWQIPGRRDAALGHYRQAIRLAERELVQSPADGVLMAQLGYYYGRVGDTAKSRAYLEAAVGKGEDGYVSYYAALAAADRGDLAAARESAATAARLGFPVAMLQADPSLAGLKSQQRTGG